MAKPIQKLRQLWQKGCEFLGVEYAILGGAMSWLSEHNLVSAISNAGGFGILAGAAMPPDLLHQEIIETRHLTKKSFGVNLITLHPQLEELLQVCINTGVNYIILAGGIPKAHTIKFLQEAGIKVICFASTFTIAKKLIQFGADALIIEGFEAGGHIGPVSTSILVQEILPHITEVPIFVAGGIGRGEIIATYLTLGAAGAQLGTLFAATKESIAHPKFKQKLIEANFRDATVSIQLDPEFAVIPVRSIPNAATKQFIQVQRESIESYKQGIISKAEAQLKIEHFWAGALRKAVIEGDIENGSLMAGQSVGFVTGLYSVEEIIAQLIQQANDFLEK